LIFEITTDQTARLTYKNSTGQSEVYEVNYRKKIKPDFKSSNLDEKTVQLPTKLKNSPDTSLEVAKVDDIIAELSCKICEFLKTAWDLTFGETSVSVKNASLIDDILPLLRPTLPSKLMFLVNQFWGNLPKIEQALQKTTDLGIDCTQITVATLEIDCKNRQTAENQRQPLPPPPQTPERNQPQSPQPSPKPSQPSPRDGFYCYGCNSIYRTNRGTINNPALNNDPRCVKTCGN